MCGVGAVAVGAGMMAYSAYSASRKQEAQNKALAYNADLLDTNSEIAETQAEWAEEIGDIASSRHRKKVSQIKGRQRAAYGASGVVVDEGSAADVVKDTAYWGEMDAMTIKSNAARQAWGHRVQAYNYNKQAKLSRMGMRSPGSAAFDSLLGTGSQLAAMYMMS